MNEVQLFWDRLTEWRSAVPLINSLIDVDGRNCCSGKPRRLADITINVCGLNAVGSPGMWYYRSSASDYGYGRRELHS